MLIKRFRLFYGKWYKCSNKRRFRSISILNHGQKYNPGRLYHTFLFWMPSYIYWFNYNANIKRNHNHLESFRLFIIAAGKLCLCWSNGYSLQLFRLSCYYFKWLYWNFHAFNNTNNRLYFLVMLIERLRMCNCHKY